MLDNIPTAITTSITSPGVPIDDLLGPVKGLGKQKHRPAIAKLVATVEALDDAGVDDVTQAIKLLLAAGRRSARRG